MAASSMSILNAGAQLSGAYAEGRAAELQGEFSEAQARQNARLAELKADEISKQGKKESSRYLRKVRGMVGSQKAGYAAQGIDISSGTAKTVQEQTAEFGIEDANTIRRNAINEAYGYRFEAIQTRAQGLMDKRAGKFERNMSFATGGLKAAASYMEGRSSKPSKSKKSQSTTVGGTADISKFGSYA